MKTPASLSALLLLVLTPVAWAAPVSIQVLGPDKKPVPNAQIRVRLWGKGEAGEKAEPLQAVTDAKGTAIIEAPADPEVEARGGVGWVTAWSPTLAITSALLKREANVVSLSAVGTARGLVVDEKGQPVANAVVRLSGIDRADDDATYAMYTAFHSKLDAEVSDARTDALGRWIMARVPLGAQIEVSLSEEKFALSSAFARVGQPEAAFDWGAVEAAAREASQVSDFRPRAGGGRGVNEEGALVARLGASVTGRVVDPNGAPVVGVQVMARAQGPTYTLQTGTTDSKGEFHIERLREGEYSLAASASRGARGQEKEIEWVAGEPLKVTVAAGAQVAAGEVKMIRGGTIEVRVLDEATGKGIAGINVYASPVVREGRMSLNPRATDAQGRAVLRVSPGKHRVTTFDSPSEYLPLSNYAKDQPTVEVAAGAPGSVVLKLKKGLPATGRIVDEAGKPIPNIGVAFRPDKREWYSSSNTVTADGKGQWKSGRFEAGPWKPYTQGSDWKIISPKSVSFPRADPFDIVLAPIARVAISGRAVDAAGAGLPNVRLALKINTVQDNMGGQTERAAVTGADGTWSVPDVPEVAQSITIQAALPGYGVTRAPIASKKDTAWAITDAQLSRRDARLAGRVLDAQGQPAPDAQVLVAQSQLAADKEGRWSLGGLASGEVEVIAVQANLAAVATTNAPNEAVSLKLKAPPTLAGRDVDGASALLEDAWQTSRGSKYGSRDRIPAVLALADPDAALQLAGGGDKKASAGAVQFIMEALVAKGDLAEAQAWAQKNLGAEGSPLKLQSIALMMAGALADSDAAAAKKWLGLARENFAGLKEDWAPRAWAGEMAAVSARLKEADANEWFERAFKLAGEGRDASSQYATLAYEVAGASEEWTVRVIEASIKTVDAQEVYMAGPDAAASWAIKRMAPLNLPGAKRLLAKYGSLKNKQGTITPIENARVEVLSQRARAGEDVDALLKEADKLEQSSTQAIALIASNGPTPRRAELLKRALELSQQKNNSYSLFETLQVLARLLPVDREAARAGLERARAVLEAPRDERDEYSRLRADEVAHWAWLYRGFDAGAARLLIEREWARGMAAPSSDQDDYRRWPGMSVLAQAMMPLDIERAQQLAERLPVSGFNAPAFGAQRAIAKWMLADEKERASQPFASWGRDREDDARYSNEW